MTAQPIVDWGARLHVIYGLPWLLERDLEHVLAELETHGFGLGPSLRAELLARPEPIALVAGLPADAAEPRAPRRACDRDALRSERSAPESRQGFGARPA